MSPLRSLFALALAIPSATTAAEVQTDHYFAVQTVDPDHASGEFIVRISETARAKAFAQAARHGQPLRMTSRIVQRPAAWNAAWPFYTERTGLFPPKRWFPVAHRTGRCRSRKSWPGVRRCMAVHGARQFASFAKSTHTRTTESV